MWGDNKVENKTKLNSFLTQSNNKTVVNRHVSDFAIIDTIGKVLAGKYKIIDKLDVKTGEADLYICSQGSDKYVAKIYRRKLAIKEEVANKLKEIDSPYVAKVYDTGEIEGYPYEILPYYKNGSLEGRKFTFEQLKTRIIPALNEGLRVLHDNGIIHKDLKPSNVMLADNGQDVAIIDFGISSLREEGNTIIVTKTGMTPEYSAPETFKNLFLNESDYYSLGITLFELFCGCTPYAALSQDEIERYVSIQKLPLPDDMREELKVLISALTYPDITNRRNKSNPNRRWGYEEILKWCVGIKQPIPGEMKPVDVESDYLKPYKFLGNEYTNIKKLIEALADNWNEGKKQLFRGLLSAYFKGFDAEVAGFCIDAEDEVVSGDEDLIFFKTLYKIDSTLVAFYWKGKKYNNISSLGKDLLDVLRKQKTKMDSFWDELLEKGILSQYLLCVNESDVQRINAVKAIESQYRAFKGNLRQKTLNYYQLAYMLSGSKVLCLGNMEFDSVQELIVFLNTILDKSYDEFDKMCHELIDFNYMLHPQFESWLLALGKKNEIEQWEKNLLR